MHDITFNSKHPFDAAKPVKVYFNLHRKCYSVQQNGLVVGHAYCIALRDVTCKVSEAGRQRVIKEQRKNVHAYMVGTIDTDVADWYDIKLTYNPYKYSSFVLWTNPDVAVYDVPQVYLRIKDAKSLILAAGEYMPSA